MKFNIHPPKNRGLRLVIDAQIHSYLVHYGQYSRRKRKMSPVSYCSLYLQVQHLRLSHFLHFPPQSLFQVSSWHILDPQLLLGILLWHPKAQDAHAYMAFVGHFPPLPGLITNYIVGCHTDCNHGPSTHLGWYQFNQDRLDDDIINLEKHGAYAKDDRTTINVQQIWFPTAGVLQRPGVQG